MTCVPIECSTMRTSKPTAGIRIALEEPHVLAGNPWADHCARIDPRHDELAFQFVMIRQAEGRKTMRDPTKLLAGRVWLAGM